MCPPSTEFALLDTDPAGVNLWLCTASGTVFVDDPPVLPALYLSPAQSKKVSLIGVHVPPIKDAGDTFFVLV